MGYYVIPANNEKSKSFGSNKFSLISLASCPEVNPDKENQNIIKLLDLLRFEKRTKKIVGAFELEKSTSNYSGILRLSDLHFRVGNKYQPFYIIIPDKRENDVKIQLSRPSIKNGNINVKYILFSELRANCEA